MSKICILSEFEIIQTYKAEDNPCLISFIYVPFKSLQSAV